MPYYDRNNEGEGIDFAKSNNNKECMVCHYWFFNHGFEFQYSFCSRCHDFSMFCFTVRDIAIITIKNVDYCYIIHNSEYEAINALIS